MLDMLSKCPDGDDPVYCTTLIEYAFEDYQRSHNLLQYTVGRLGYNFGIHHGTTQNRLKEYKMVLDQELRDKYLDQ